jgi:DNA (cytosine-5)-methyltransferase 1
MNYLSVCSGVEAATVAWHHMGWNPVGFGEIEKFPSEVLAHHYPNITNFGDMTKYKEWKIDGTIGLLVGGTPCQSFSVAGLRKGLDDPRGNLALTYLGILDHFRPKWCVWENVPGVLSSGGGRDFGAFLGALGELGYGFAYRVLDAQNFGVAQRRRRVFVVGYLGDWRPAAEVLFESDCLRGDIKSSREKREETAKCLTTRIRNDHETETFITHCADKFPTLLSSTAGVSRPGNAVTEHETYIAYAMQGNLIGRDAGGPQGIGVSDSNTMYTLTKTDVHAVAYGFEPGIAKREGNPNRFTEEMSSTLRAKMGDNQAAVAFGWQNSASQSMSADVISPTLDKSKTPAVAFAQQPIPEYYAHQYCQDRVYSTEGITPALNCSQAHKFRFDMAVRRLTPIECERLQGFPDDYTNIKDKCPDGPRYKAMGNSMGNSMAVPVMRWIGERINKVNNEQ